jgi:hypothetical protein
MKTIELTRGMMTVVDDVWFEWLSTFNWCAVKSGRNFYAARAESPGGKFRMIMMHRVILGIDSAPRWMEGDHKNRSTLDNRAKNLRVATHQQNMRNRLSHRGSTSPFRGVYFDKQSGTYKAKLGTGTGYVYLGSSSDDRKCAAMYDDAVKKLKCNFATTNSGLRYVSN